MAMYHLYFCKVWRIYSDFTLKATSDVKIGSVKKIKNLTPTPIRLTNLIDTFCTVGCVGALAVNTLQIENKRACNVQVKISFLFKMTNFLYILQCGV